MTTRVVSIISRMNVGGPAVLLSELVEKLPPSEFEHILITGRCLPNEIDFLATHPFPGEIVFLESLRRTILPIGDLKSFFRLIALIRKLKPDLIHTHTSKAGFLGRIAARIGHPKTKVVHTFHGHLLYGYFNKSMRFQIIQFERFLSKLSNVLIGVTRQVRDELLGVGIGTTNKWRVIYPGISQYKTLDNSDFREKLAIDDETLVVSWIGRFTDIKSPLLALESFKSACASSRQKLLLVMVGEGELFEQSKKYARDNSLNVRFMGWSSHVREILASTDLLVMSSKNEGMPIVILEAAASGCPTISTNVGGVSEFITDSKTGWLVAPTALDLTAGILEATESLENLRAVGKNAKANFLQNFTLEKYVEDHLALYRSLTNHRD